MNDFGAEASRIVAKSEERFARFTQGEKEYAEKQAAMLRDFLDAVPGSTTVVSPAQVYRLVEEDLSPQPRAHRRGFRRTTAEDWPTVTWKFEETGKAWILASDYPGPDDIPNRRHPSRHDALTTDGNMVGCVRLLIPAATQGGANYLSLRDSISRDATPLDYFKSTSSGKPFPISHQEPVVSVQTSGITPGVDCILVACEAPLPLGVRAVRGSSHWIQPDQGLTTLKRTLIFNLTGIWP